MWGHSTAQRGILERGDVEEGLGAAAAIGDDRIQRQSQGHVTPDAFTHGSSAQRVEWFKRGLTSGDPNQCDIRSRTRRSRFREAVSVETESSPAVRSRA